MGLYPFCLSCCLAKSNQCGSCTCNDACTDACTCSGALGIGNSSTTGRRDDDDGDGHGHVHGHNGRDGNNGWMGTAAKSGTRTRRTNDSSSSCCMRPIRNDRPNNHTGTRSRESRSCNNRRTFWFWVFGTSLKVFAILVVVPFAVGSRCYQLYR